ncbi:MAG: SDR family oxidoreductase [Candidatus Rokubacteria bacterium]|nr:SDR family oxidoreductase [Candidatus Rokubacteria bacterium]
MDLELTGKVAGITGGSEGIGLATAQRLAQEGARVAICARRKDVLEAAADTVRSTTGANVLAVAADVARRGEPERFVEETLARFGRIDVLVNNAGREAIGPFEAADDDAWQADLDLKLFGAIRTIRAALPAMRKSGGGRIINVTHVSAKQPRARSVPTSVSRAAGIALTKALSKELAEAGILVNTVCVGLIWSGQWERRRLALSPPPSPAEYERRLLDERAPVNGPIPLGRMGRSEEVADLIAFLASARASYITGTAINIDGGISGVV